MESKRNSLLGISAIAVAIVSVGALNQVSAHGFMGDHSDETRTEMRQVMKDGTYEDWQALHDKKYQQEKEEMTPERFEVMQKVHSLYESGDIDGAKALAEENDLPMPGRMMHKGENIRGEAIRAALDAGDFDAWQEAVGDRAVNNAITAENFPKLLELHKLKQAGDFEGARALEKELGLPAQQGPRGHNPGMGGGFGQR